MKKIVSTLICFCLLFTSGAVFATGDLADNARINLIDTVAEVQEMFPQASIDEKVIAKIEKNYRDGLLPECMNQDAKPTQIFINKVSENETYTLKVFEDGSFGLEGLKTEFDPNEGTRYDITGKAVSSYYYSVWRYAMEVGFRYYDGTGVGNFTSNKIIVAGFVIPVNCWYNSLSAYATGNATSNGEPIMGIRLKAFLGTYGSVTTGYDLGLPY